MQCWQQCMQLHSYNIGNCGEFKEKQGLGRHYFLHVNICGKFENHY